MGFVLINDYSCLGERIDHAIAEFTIFPRYRKNGYAREAVRQVFQTRPGRWEIIFSENNAPAKVFWMKVTQERTPHITALEDGETALRMLATRSQLETLGILTEILIIVGILIAITFTRLFAETTVQRIIVLCSGCFVWGFGLFLRVRIRKTLTDLKKDPE